MTLATSVRLRAVVSDGKSGSMLNSFGFKTAGQIKRRKMKALTDVNCTSGSLGHRSDASWRTDCSTALSSGGQCAICASTPAMMRSTCPSRTPRFSSRPFRVGSSSHDALSSKSSRTGSRMAACKKGRAHSFINWSKTFVASVLPRKSVPVDFSEATSFETSVCVSDSMLSVASHRRTMCLPNSASCPFVASATASTLASVPSVSKSDNSAYSFSGRTWVDMKRTLSRIDAPFTPSMSIGHHRSATTFGVKASSWIVTSPMLRSFTLPRLYSVTRS
mmetsp:Transcript_15981/g.41340  ORF Transcript_15981/g.41340 Transcript_15981/m.41340 type:complete len:276 (-) Transcript_15981:626-1453(-)